MAKKHGHESQQQAPAPEQQAAGDKQLVIESLRKVISDPKSKALDRTRAADTLGRLAEYSWFSKPQDPTQQETGIDARTAKRLCELSDRLLAPALANCPHCGGKLSAD